MSTESIPKMSFNDDCTVVFRDFETNEIKFVFLNVKLNGIAYSGNERLASGGKSNNNLILWQDNVNNSFELRIPYFDYKVLGLLANTNPSFDYYDIPYYQEMRMNEFKTVTLDYIPTGSVSIGIKSNLDGSFIGFLTENVDYTIIEDEITFAEESSDLFFANYYIEEEATKISYNTNIQNLVYKIEVFTTLKSKTGGIINFSFVLPKVSIVSNLQMILNLEANLNDYFVIRCEALKERNLPLIDFFLNY